MKNKKNKKMLLKIFASVQILFLGLGNASPASAVWTSLRNETSKSLPSGIQDQSEYDIVSSYKRSDVTPRVSVMFSPTNPKVGEKVTATANAMAFANDPENLYYTWFLKRKQCAVDGANENQFAVKSEDYDPDEDYATHEEIVADDPEAAACDLDEDGIVTVNDWKVEAMREVAQKGFEPDLGGRYKTQAEFFSDDSDGDGYRTWQGGADAERMPAHCYGYDATSGIMFEFLDQYLKAVPMCPAPDGESKYPAECGVTRSATLTSADYDWCYCNEGTEAHPEVYSVGECSALDSSSPPTDWPACSGGLQAPSGYCCINSDAITTYHYHCQATSGSHLGCEAAPQIQPRCGEIEGSDKLAALCGPDDNHDGLEDDAVGGGVRTVAGRDGRMAALCPKYGSTIGLLAYPPTSLSEHLSQTEFNSQVSTGFVWDQSYYLFNDNAGDSMENLPKCFCDRIQVYYSNPLGGDEVPYTGSDDEPLCEDRSPTEKDLLCGNDSGPVALSMKKQFHVFPQFPEEKDSRGNRRFPDPDNDRRAIDYYGFTRDYFDDDNDEKFSYRLGNNSGDNSFGKDEEEFWGTDPRNPSTAGNGKPDEANVAGLGATEFSWIYQAGDEVGVAVEGTSTVGTKFPDSSRMIMWAFSKSENKTTSSDDEADAACQPRYSGIYEIADYDNMQKVALISIPTILQMPTGFMDFDRCIEKSAIPLVAGGGADGAQPKAMEVELSVSPSNPINDESDAGRGDTVDIQAIVSGSANPESNLNFSWEIKKFQPVVDQNTDLSVMPTDADWKGAPVICGEGSEDVCPLESGSGGKIKTQGIGLSGIDFRLNLKPEDTIYGELFNEIGEGFFQVRVEARETDDLSSPPNSRAGYGEAVIKISSIQNQIEVYRPKIISSGGKDKLSTTGLGAICGEGAERAVCPVTKNEIIGLSADLTAKFNDTVSENLTDFDWFAQGRTLGQCDLEMSDQCKNDRQTEFTFFPVVGNVGDTFTVGVKANNIAGQADGQTGKRVEMVRKFQIVDPSVRIVPAGAGVKKKKIGSFVDPTMSNDDAGKYVDDFSESILETSSGNDVVLKLDYTPDYIVDVVSAENWQIDGALSGTPQFTAGPLGTIHNVSAGVSYAQSTGTYRMLKSKFGVSPDEMVSQNIGHSVQVEVNLETPAEIGLKNPVRFMANLFSKIPVQILFLVRLILSMATVLVLTGMIFSFFPATGYGDRKRI